MLVGNWSFGQDVNCARTTNFGSVEICLPKIKGYQECYLEENIKLMADATEVPANMIIGYYLNREMYSIKDSLGIDRLDNFFKVYGTKQIQDFNADTETLKLMEDGLSQNFLVENWDSLQVHVEKLKLEAKIGIPVAIKSYNLNDQSFSKVMLINYQIGDDEPYTVALTINGMLLNKRLIWMAYYLIYVNEDTIEQLQENSNDILTKLLNAQD